jgi:hypothetical protein
MAETTATQRSSRAASTTIFAARLMQDASPTDVPPNFITCNLFFISLVCECGKINPTVVEAPLSLPPLHTLYRSGLVPSGDGLMKMTCSGQPCLLIWTEKHAKLCGISGSRSTGIIHKKHTKLARWD